MDNIQTSSTENLIEGWDSALMNNFIEYSQVELEQTIELLQGISTQINLELYLGCSSETWNKFKISLNKLNQTLTIGHPQHGLPIAQEAGQSYELLGRAKNLVAQILDVENQTDKAKTLQTFKQDFATIDSVIETAKAEPTKELVFGVHVWLGKQTSEGKYEPDLTGVLALEGIVNILRNSPGTQATVLIAGGHAATYGGITIVDMYGDKLKQLIARDPSLSNRIQLKIEPGPNMATSTVGESAYFSKYISEMNETPIAVLIMCANSHRDRVGDLSRGHGIYNPQIISYEASAIWSNETNREEHLPRRIEAVYQGKTGGLYEKILGGIIRYVDHKGRSLDMPSKVLGTVKQRLATRAHGRDL